MWIILKYKKKELNYLKEDLRKKIGSLPYMYLPKIKCQKLIKNKLRLSEVDVLEDYLICYHKKFEDSNIFKILNYSRGLKYFLTNSISNQKEINNFVQYCKSNQDNDGYLKQSFFESSNFKKGIFLNGPLTNMIFKIINKKKEKLNVLIGNVKISISNSSNYFYRSI